MDFKDLSANLTNSKISIQERIICLKKLKEISADLKSKDQFILDWLSSTLEYISKTEKLLICNAGEINELIRLFNSELEKNINSINKRCFLKSNFLDIFSKYFNYPDILRQQDIISCWRWVLCDESWSYPLHIKVNLLVDVLENFCKHLSENGINVSCGLMEESSVIVKLTNIYNKHIKSQFNIKKTFKQFCSKLLLHLLCVQTLYRNSESEDAVRVSHSIDTCVINVLCDKEHMNNLKTLIPSLTSECHKEPPTKKPKINIYFEIFFNQFHDIPSKIKALVLPSAPMVLEYLITASRRSGNVLSHLEEFQLFIHLVNIFKLEDLFCGKEERCKELEALLKMFEVVTKHDLYQPLEDKNSGNTLYEWMSKRFGQLKLLYAQSDDADKKTVLCIFRSLLCINHVVLEKDLQFLWSICICKKSTSEELQEAKENLLCELLDTFGKLYQVDRFISYLYVSADDPNHVHLPNTFTARYSSIVVQLQTKQINTLLELFLRQCDIHLKAPSEHSVAMLEQHSFLLCYLTLRNAAVIPENGYMKTDLLDLIENVKRLKLKLLSFTSVHTAGQQIKDRLICISYLIQHGINNFYLFLKEYKLDDECLESTIQIDVVHDTPSCKELLLFLKVCLCFDELRFGKNIKKTLKTLYELVQDLHQETQHTKRIGEYKFQYSNINSMNILDAVLHVFEDNFLLLLCYDDEVKGDILVQWFVQHAWSRSLVSTFQLLDNYNIRRFQVCLLSTIHKSFETIIGCSTNFDMVSFFERLNIPINVEQHDTDFIQKQLKQWENVQTTVDREALLKINALLKAIDLLPLGFFAVESSTFLAVILLRIQKMLPEDEISLQNQCFLLLRKLCENIVLTCAKAAYIPYSVVLRRYLSYFMKNIEIQSDEELVSVFASLLSALIHNGELSDAVDQISTHLREHKTQVVTLRLCSKVLTVISQFLLNPTLKSRSEQAAYNLILLLFEPIVNLVRIKNQSTLAINIYTQLCNVIHQAFLKGKQSRLGVLNFDDLIQITSLLKPNVEKSLIINCTDVDCQIQCVKLLLLAYEESSTITIKIKSTLQLEDKVLLLAILNLLETSPTCVKPFLYQLCQKIVLQAHEESLLDILNIITDDLTCTLISSYKTTSAPLWEVLLSGKWTKEQRIVLWNVLPKVMLSFIELLTRGQNIQSMGNIVNVLIGAVNIGKNSLMSSYVTCVYHGFTIVLNNVKKLNTLEGFGLFYGRLYQLASQLLFNHQSAVYTSLPSFLQGVNTLLELLALFSRSADASSKDICFCCEKFARLYREIGNHKSIITKYSPYIISEYLGICQTTTFSAQNKRILDGGMYCILDTCTEFEFSLLSATLEKGDKEHFRLLRNHYEKHHKFEGKA